MSRYFETDAFEGETPFKCYVCGKVLMTDVEGEYTIKLNCPRCKTAIVLKTEQPLPDGLVVKHGELTRL